MSAYRSNALERTTAARPCRRCAKPTRRRANGHPLCRTCRKADVAKARQG